MRSTLQPSLWMLLLALATLVLSASRAHAQRDSAVITFDSVRLSSYSNQQLIDLLTRDAIDANLTATGGLVYVLPSRQFDTTPPPRDSSYVNPRPQTVNFNLQRASTLPYPSTVVGELTRRGASQDLMRAFGASEDWTQLNWLEATLSLLRSRPVDSSMTLFAKRGARDEQGYLATLYLAEAGSCWALDQLDRDYAELPISSMEKVEVVTLFRRYRYYPAAAHLAETISAMLVNLGDAALEALVTMYPQGPSNFDGPMSAAEHWQRYVAKHRRDRSASQCT